MSRRKEAHRFYIPKAIWFFTVNLAERRNNTLLVEKINELRYAFRYVKTSKLFEINATVVMPDHLHCIWTLPPDDGDFLIRWNMLKRRFSCAIDSSESISKSCKNAASEALTQGHKWQRRF
jgi:putative transposase